MSIKLQQSTTEESRGSAPVTARRRATAQFPGLSSKPKTDDIPVLIRLPDLAKFAAQSRREIAPEVKPTLLAAVKDRVTAPTVAPIPAKTTTETPDESSQDLLNRADQRRKRRAVEAPPAQDWRRLAMQWGTILAIVIVVSVLFHLFQRNGKHQTTEPESTASQTADPSANQVQAELTTPVIEPAPMAVEDQENAPPAPITIEPKPAAKELPDFNFPAPKSVAPPKNPSTEFAPNDSTQNESRRDLILENPMPPSPSFDRGVNPNQNGAPDDRDFDPETARYPITDPSNYLYRPGSTANPARPPFDSFGRDSLPNSGASNRDAMADSFRDDSVRAARIHGIQNLPPRERR